VQTPVLVLKAYWYGQCQQVNTVQKELWLVMLAAGCAVGSSEHADCQQPAECTTQAIDCHDSRQAVVIACGNTAPSLLWQALLLRALPFLLANLAPCECFHSPWRLQQA